MPEGFEFCLPDFCSFCGEFEPDVQRQDITLISDNTGRYLTTIHCENMGKCLRLVDKLNEGMK